MLRFLLICIISTFTLQAHARKVTVNFSDLSKRTGKILFAIYDSADEFPKGKPIHHGSVEVNKKAKIARASFDLEEGEYALSAFLDENGNEELDTNLFGVPSERFGFSGNPRILTGPPEYEDSAFDLKKSQTLDVKLIRLLDQ